MVLTQSSATMLKAFDLALLQPVDGYRFSVDSLLLVDFVRVPKDSKILDIGTGCGVISLCLARRQESASFVAIEIQESLFLLARENVKNNRLGDRVSVIKGDINDAYDKFNAGEFNVVVSNPPYRTPDSGRLCPHSQEALARHEIFLELPSLLKAVRFVLCPGGLFFLIYPSERLGILIHGLSENGLEPKRLQFIHPNSARQARMVMVEAVKDGKKGGLRVMPPLFLM